MVQVVASNEVIAVSGVGVPQGGILFPSGLFPVNTPGANLCAFLASANATFGFNLTPHVFNLEWIPCGPACDFHGASGQLPPIYSPFELFIGDFFLRGVVTHSDYTSTSNGTIVNMTVEDDRKSLRRLKIQTEDLGENVPSGVVSVARAFRRINGLTTVVGDPSDPLIKEYENILKIGCTYAQVLAAIDLTFNESLTEIPISVLPTVAQLELNIGGKIDAIRFQFNLTTLDEVLSRVLQDTGFDWYYGMDNQRVNLANKKTDFDIDENDILNLVSQFGSTSGLNETEIIGFGQDIVSDPTRFRLLGGHQRGFINSDILSPIDGIDTSALDGNVTFTSAWDRLSIGFYDSDGFYRTYTPTEKELQLALAGIEQWSYYKIYQSLPSTNDPAGYGILPDAGSIAAQHPTFQSRIDSAMPLAGEATGAGISGIRIISNRRDADHNWTIDFFTRVRDHASRHYGRSYVLEGLLFNEASGLFRPIPGAWANVENQIQGGTLSPSGSVGGLFTEDYEINRQLGPISPFVADDFQVRAHCVLPADTGYGPLGEDAPASFGNWTEDAMPFNPSGDGKHYIPVDLQIVGQQVINPRSDDLYSFEVYPEGTLLCQLPVNAGPGSGFVTDNIINSLATLLTTRTKLNGSGLLDIINPGTILNAYQTLSGVAIPVEARTRYGQGFPSTWVDGTFHPERDEDVQLDDQFVPWAFFPVGDKTSLDIMTDRAITRVRGKTVSDSSSRYADYSQIGLPLLSFDAFAEQGIGEGGLYGEISHGVSEVNIQFGLQGFVTRYKIKSYFSQFGREAPLGERLRAQLNGIINPVDFESLRLLDQVPPIPGDPLLPGDTLPPITFFDNEKRAVRVTITEVNNFFTLASVGDPELERYVGEDQNAYQKPAQFTSSNPDFVDGAICLDGFLNINDQAIYHTDEFESDTGNTIFRYFTGGRPFGNGTIVEVQNISASNGSNFDVTIVDPTASSNGIDRAIRNIPVLNGVVQIGDKTTLAAQGDATVVPGPSVKGLFLTGTTTSNGIPIQVIDRIFPGTSGTIAVCRRLTGALDPDTGSALVSGVAFPFPQFVQVGDQGVAFATTDQSTLIFIARQPFIGLQ